MRQTTIFTCAARKLLRNEVFSIIKIKVSGDTDQVTPMHEMQGFGAFVRELDRALLDGQIDVSVNSLKDVPIDGTPGITTVAVLPRDAVEDVSIPCPLSELPDGAVVGTSSLRREALIRTHHPNLKTEPIRGNIHTRLEKLDSGKYDAIVLAKAGLDRMGIERKVSVLDPNIFIPAPAQGTISISCRSSDTVTIKKLEALDNKPSRLETDFERTIMKMMGAGCTSPIGINAKKLGGTLHVRAVSFEYSEEPICVDVRISAKYDEEDLYNIVNRLKGGS
jgi:hydroxymethylbilane synthase